MIAGRQTGEVTFGSYRVVRAPLLDSFWKTMLSRRSGSGQGEAHPRRPAIPGNRLGGGKRESQRKCLLCAFACCFLRMSTWCTLRPCSQILTSQSRTSTVFVAANALCKTYMLQESGVSCDFEDNGQKAKAALSLSKYSAEAGHVFKSKAL